MSVGPMLRRGAVAGIASGAILVTSALAAPGHDRIALLGSTSVPLPEDATVLVADLRGPAHGERLAELLGEGASSLDLTAVLAGEAEPAVGLVREADVVVVVDPSLAVPQDGVPADGEVLASDALDEGRPTSDAPPAADDGASDDDAPEGTVAATCAPQVTAWLVGLGTPSVTVTTGRPGTGEDPPEAGPPADALVVLDPDVTEAEVVAVLTGEQSAAGTLPEPLASPAPETTETECPELPEVEPLPEPTDPDEPPGSPEPTDPPESTAPPRGDGPEQPSPEPTDPGTAPTDGPGEPPEDAPAPSPDPEAPEAPEDEPRIPGTEVPGIPAPGPPPVFSEDDAPQRTPFRLPATRSKVPPLAMSLAPGGLDLSDVVVDGDRITLRGELPGVSVVDLRKGDARGWTLSAQVSDLEGPAVLPASQLGWTPRVHDERATAGPALAPALSGGPGLAGPVVLASAPRGTAGDPVELDAAVVLETTRDAVPGRYAGAITLTLFPEE